MYTLAPCSAYQYVYRFGGPTKKIRARLFQFSTIFLREKSALAPSLFIAAGGMWRRERACVRATGPVARARDHGAPGRRAWTARARARTPRARGREICVRDREKTPVKYAGGRRQAAPHVPLFRAGERRAVHLTNTISAKKAETGEGRALPIVLSSRLYTYNARFTQ